ncbi:hypothetical protein BCR43DRAFT_250332 [Syncephalastrum racemosum]|uniref:Uncharacterized protein n=1 Tax=Syncephalastrum racemosum TaxID=13706 RepID=A0A1X2HFQ7_SYNRA|nr:hypothetical protein BCR43DRAFT_250332 [Syncephalastrum racemosum]
MSYRKKRNKKKQGRKGRKAEGLMDIIIFSFLSLVSSAKNRIRVTPPFTGTERFTLKFDYHIIQSNAFFIYVRESDRETEAFPFCCFCFFFILTARQPFPTIGLVKLILRLVACALTCMASGSMPPPPPWPLFLDRPDTISSTRSNKHAD